eukprot:COSAG06_NODE_693_length_13038_cov_3.976428_4_plen_175_part_00
MLAAAWCSLSLATVSAGCCVDQEDQDEEEEEDERAMPSTQKRKGEKQTHKKKKAKKGSAAEKPAGNDDEDEDEDYMCKECKPLVASVLNLYINHLSNEEEFRLFVRKGSMKAFLIAFAQAAGPGGATHDVMKSLLARGSKDARLVFVGGRCVSGCLLCYPCCPSPYANAPCSIG